MKGVQHMRHDYYYFNKGELLAAPRIPLEVMADNAAVFRTIAREMADEIKKNNAAGRRTVFICPVGPVGQYPYFVELVNRESICLKDCWFLNMDEYLTDDKAWIESAHPLSFRGFMERTVYSRIRPELLMPPAQRVFPDPRDPAAMDALIEKLGGVDICFGGIGINGHLAFNEARDELSGEEFLSLPTRVLAISRETRTANAIGDFNGALDDMPSWCVTIGMRQIYGARKIRLGVFRDWHRAVVRHAAYGQPSAHFPVTLLQNHPDALVRLTEHVANLSE